MCITAGNQAWSLDDEAAVIMQRCRTVFTYLLQALCHGNILHGHLETILKHRDHFKKVYFQCKLFFK